MSRALVSAQELSHILSLSVDTILRYTHEKKIPYIEIGPQEYRYNEEDVLRALNPDTSLIKEESSKFSHARKITSDDYAKLPEETGFSIELIDGHLLREPTPTYQHQRLSRRLQRILEDYFFQVDPKGEVFVAPLDTYLNKHTVVQPDLLYLPGKRPAKNNPVDSIPELVAEIVSPSSVHHDRVIKLNCYQQAGITHYWIVDSANCLIEAYELLDGHYASIVRYSKGVFSHPSFPGLAFDVDVFFESFN